MADGLLISCESSLVVQLLLGMLIWPRGRRPSEGVTVDRLMAAIGVVGFQGLRNSARPT